MASASVLKDDSKAMPPPPLPEATVTTATKILQPEFAALATCLKDAIVKTGQIYSFYADARRLGISKHISHPPRSLTDDLGRDIEKYDQLCDSIEARLVRAIKVLKRDLRREEQRKEEEEKRKTAEASMLPPPTPPLPSELAVEDSTLQSSPTAENSSIRSSPVVGPLGRRPSAISISSLHRPQFPLKLDLSSSTLRITEEEAAAMYHKGPASPVTLVPKSARAIGPNEFPPDFMAAFANQPIATDMVHGPATMDLTLPNGMHMPESLGVGFGDSSEKPIELDLDSMDIEMANMTDLFGDSADADEGNGTHDGLFSPALGQGEGESLQTGAANEVQKDQDNVLGDFQMDTNVNDELFGDFTSEPDLVQGGGTAGTSDLPITEGGEGFDLDSLDLSNLDSATFFSNTQDREMNFDMDSILIMDSVPPVKKEENAEGPSTSQT